MKFVYLISFIFNFSFFAQAQKNMDHSKLPCQIIYKIDVNVKSKRPNKNPTPPQWKYALLNICKPENEKEIPQRQVIGVEWMGKSYWKELIQIDQLFEAEEDAFEYAKTNEIPIANFKDKPSKVDYLVDNTVTSTETKKNIIGIANNAKAGACLIDEKDSVFFIEGLMEWKETFLKKRIGVIGSIKAKEHQEPLINEKGEYRGASSGTSVFIVKPELPELRVSPSLIVVFKLEIKEQVAINLMEQTGYPYFEGMDSSKGKIYFSKTGFHYHILFPSETEKEKFKINFSRNTEIFEIYQPDWTIQKD